MRRSIQFLAGAGVAASSTSNAAPPAAFSQQPQRIPLSAYQRHHHHVAATRGGGASFADSIAHATSAAATSPSATATRTLEASMAAALAEAELSDMIDTIDGDGDTALSQGARSKSAVHQRGGGGGRPPPLSAEERRALAGAVLRDVDALAAVFEAGDTDRAMRLVAALAEEEEAAHHLRCTASSHQHSGTTEAAEGEALPSSPATATTFNALSAAVRARLGRVVSSLADDADVHSLQTLERLLRPPQQQQQQAPTSSKSGDTDAVATEKAATDDAGRVSFPSAFLRLRPAHRDALYCDTIDGLLLAIAEADYMGATSFRNMGMGKEVTKKSKSGSSQGFDSFDDDGYAVGSGGGKGGGDFQQRRLAIVADAAGRLSMDSAANRAWLDSKYRGVPYSLAVSHPDAKRIEVLLYRRHHQQQQRERSASEPSTCNPNTDGQMAGVAVASSKQQEEAVPEGTAPAPSPAPSRRSAPPPPPLSAATGPLLATASPKQLRDVVAKYEKALAGTAALFQPSSATTSGGKGRGRGGESQYLRLAGPHARRLRQLHLQSVGPPLAALLYLGDYAGAERLLRLACGDGGIGVPPAEAAANRRAAQRAAALVLTREALAATTAAAQRRLLHRVFTPTTMKSTPRTVAKRGGGQQRHLLALVTGKNAAIVAHDLHMAFMVSSSTANTLSSSSLPSPTMATDSVVEAHFVSTMRALVASAKDSTHLVNLAFASSVAMGDATPCWAASVDASAAVAASSSGRRGGLFSAVVSATCRELERPAADGAVTSGSLFAPDSPFRLHFIPRKVHTLSHPPQQFRHHRTLKGFAQHLLTSPARFPAAADADRLALMTSLINCGNKEGIVRRGLDALAASIDVKGTEGASSTKVKGDGDAADASDALASRRQWLWDMAWLLSDFAWEAPATSAAAAAESAPAPSDAAASNIVVPTPMAVSLMWGFMSSGRRSAARAPGAADTFAYLAPCPAATDAASEAALSPRQRALALLARVVMAGPNVHRRRHVRSAHWCEDEDRLVDSPVTEESASAASTAAADSPLSVAARRNALLSLASLLDSNEDFWLMVRACVSLRGAEEGKQQHQQPPLVGADGLFESEHGRLELLLRAEGAL